MYSLIIQATAAERGQDMQVRAATARRVREIRRGRQAQPARRWLPMGLPRAGRGPSPLPAPRLLRGPRAA